MSYQKAADLLRLAEMATSRYSGVSLSEIEEEFSVDRRTAQRMTKMLEETFPNYVTKTDEDRRKFWRLNASDARLMLAQGIRDSELAALDIAIQRAERDGVTNEVQSLRTLRDRLLAAMPGPHARRAETDAEALLEAYGFASRPGPQMRAKPDLLRLIAEALKGPHSLRVKYQSGSGGEVRERILEPHGMLLGTRRYLIAREKGRDGKMQHYRVDRIVSALLEATSFHRDENFDLSSYSARAFGSYYNEKEYDEVVWRFNPLAAPAARGFVFHPEQEVTDETDGSLTVCFRAAGHLEMAWHLYQWGDAVEVLAPEALRVLTQEHRRSDFTALP